MTSDFYKLRLAQKDSPFDRLRANGENVNIIVRSW